MTSRPYHGVTLWAVPRFRRSEQPTARQMDQQDLTNGAVCAPCEPKLQREAALTEGNGEIAPCPAATH